MSDRDPLHQIEVRCAEVQRSPYLYRDLPPELQRLQSMVKNVDLLVRHDVPFLISEVKRLRSENKKLLAESAEMAQANRTADFDGNGAGGEMPNGITPAVRVDGLGAADHVAAS